MATSQAVARVKLARRPAPRLAREALPIERPSLREASPFLKWVGGKGKLLSQLLPLLPPGADRMRHVEPFTGGGAMFFARSPQRALLCDLNASLVDTYLAVRDDVEGVIDELGVLSAAHAATGTYYRVRERYNAERRAMSRNERAAAFVYLNKTCFNGLHRVNRRGEFNVPEGRYKNPRILDEHALRSASSVLQRAEIKHTSFEGLLSLAKPGDFVYLDPPYEPVSTTASFVAYGADGFAREDQTRLRDVVNELDRRGCKIMLSNSDVPFIREIYARYRIDTVAAPRAINCDADKRGLVSEVVVRNY
ncbi:MAG: DNA adenine methylase [Sandaracinus sp.]